MHSSRTPIELRTDRLLLRPFGADDVDDALAYRDDVEFSRYLTHIPQPFTLADARAFVATNMALDWTRSATFAVVVESRVIGTVNLEFEQGERAAMLGYAIGRSWWGRGLATEAAAAVLAWGSDRFDVTRVWASTDVRHVSSRRVMEKLGMTREGVIVAHHRGRSNEPIDEVVYARRVER